MKRQDFQNITQALPLFDTLCFCKKRFQCLMYQGNRTFLCCLYVFDVMILLVLYNFGVTYDFKNTGIGDVYFCFCLITNRPNLLYLSTNDQVLNRYIETYNLLYTLIEVTWTGTSTKSVWGQSSASGHFGLRWNIWTVNKASNKMMFPPDIGSFVL